MSYLTYDKKFQNEIITSKQSGVRVKDICNNFGISVYTLYKIMHMNGKMPTPSQASEGTGSEEGVEHRNLSPNNNNSHERSTSTWKDYGGDRHRKIEYACLNCNERFMARDRGNRTKFCSRECQSEYQTKTNSTIKKCAHCGNEFIIKNSLAKVYVFCNECRKQNVRYPTSIMAKNIINWLVEGEFNIEVEKTFDWFYDKNKPKGRFRLDVFLPDYNTGIEYDGEQHFKPCFTSKYETVDRIKERDILKTKLCKEHSVKLIRFRYDEIITKNSMLMKIYAELQGNEPVETQDKKLV